MCTNTNKTLRTATCTSAMIASSGPERSCRRCSSRWLQLYWIWNGARLQAVSLDIVSEDARQRRVFQQNGFFAFLRFLFYLSTFCPRVSPDSGLGRSLAKRWPVCQFPSFYRVRLAPRRRHQTNHSNRCIPWRVGCLLSVCVQVSFARD